ncbi:ATP-binding protein [Nitriliruptoraceae bacterium ZYF776]|nr:ATP-binding protein [Profundirhabdus halotolerans]
MATAEQVKALLRSHGDQDDERFYAVALQVAAAAARKGQHRLAQELRDLVDETNETRRSSRSERVTPVVRPKGDLAGLIDASYPETRLTDMVLDDSAAATLTRTVREYQLRDRLRGHGFEPIRKLLLAGPPGTGKTMSASALAGELRLPLFTTRLDGLITKFMGETAAKLRLIFDTIADTRGVYLFDEVDALAAARQATNDVGEARRILNSFLQFVEQDHSDSLIVAATNHAHLLDAALFRRFHVTVQFELPSAVQIRQVIENRLASLDTSKISWRDIEHAAEGLSHADATVACEDAAKATLMSDSETVDTKSLSSALRARQRRVD